MCVCACVFTRTRMCASVCAYAGVEVQARGRGAQCVCMCMHVSVSVWLGGGQACTFLSARPASHCSVSFFSLSFVSLTWQLSVAAPRYSYLFLLSSSQKVPGSEVDQPHLGLQDSYLEVEGWGWCSSTGVCLTGTQQSLVLNPRGITSSKRSPVPYSHWRPEGPEKSELLDVFKKGSLRDVKPQ